VLFDEQGRACACWGNGLAWPALAAAAYLFGGSVVLAADLGGASCADLKQRVAEPESAAVRKTGKVSVTISGYVTKQVFAWDDGVEQNIYVTDIGPTQATNFRLNGPHVATELHTRLFGPGNSDQSRPSSSQTRRTTRGSRIW
jgi:hypothetical protein